MKLKRLLPIVLTIALAQLSSAAIVVDQSQLSGPVYMAGFGQSDLAQSFQQSAANIAGAEVLLQLTGSGTGDITISLYDALPNNGGNLLAAGTDSGVGAGQWASVLWSPVVVIPNTTYYLVFTSSNNTLGLTGDTNNPYALGNVYANTGFNSFPGFDYTFQTFADDQLSGSSVPEPASLFLLGAGLVALTARKKLS